MKRLHITTTFGTDFKIETLWATQRRWRDPKTGQCSNRAGYITRIMRRERRYVDRVEWWPDLTRLPDEEGRLTNDPIGPVFSVKAAREQHHAACQAYILIKRREAQAMLDATASPETEEVEVEA